MMTGRSDPAMTRGGERPTGPARLTPAQERGLRGLATSAADDPRVLSVPLICYASRTGTRRNLAALRAAGWRLLVSRAGVWRTEDFPYAIDNGAYSDYTAGREFDGEAFQRLIDLLGGQADWVVAPDIVAGGRASLLLSLRWLPHLLLRTRLVLLAVQDGLEPADMVTVIRDCGKRAGIFLGGSTEWKLATMQRWGEFCAAERCYYHVARVNTLTRIRRAIAAGADSIDGSSATRFSVNVRPLDFAARQWDLWAPNRTRVAMPEMAAGRAWLAAREGEDGNKD